MQPFTVKIEFPFWAMPNPPLGIPGAAALRAGPGGADDAAVAPDGAPVGAAAGNTAFPPGAPGPDALAEAPPFEAVADFAFAEIEFPFAKMEETTPAHEELLEVPEAVPVAAVLAVLGVAVGADVDAGAVEITLFATAVDAGAVIAELGLTAAAGAGVGLAAAALEAATCAAAACRAATACAAAV